MKLSCWYLALKVHLNSLKNTTDEPWVQGIISWIEFCPSPEDCSKNFFKYSQVCVSRSRWLVLSIFVIHLCLCLNTYAWIDWSIVTSGVNSVETSNHKWIAVSWPYVACGFVGQLFRQGYLDWKSVWICCWTGTGIRWCWTCERAVWITFNFDKFNSQVAKLGELCFVDWRRRYETGPIILSVGAVAVIEQCWNWQLCLVALIFDILASQKVDVSIHCFTVQVGG